MLDSDSIFNNSAEIVHSVRRKRLLHATISAELTLLFAFIAYLVTGSSEVLLPITAVALLISVIFILIRFNKLDLAITLFLLILSFTMLFFMWSYEGNKDETILIYPTIITFAVILGDKRFTIGLFVFIIANILTMGYLNSEGIITHGVSQPSMVSAMVTSILVALVSYSIWQLSSDIRDLLKKISAENKRVENSKERIQKLLDNEKRLREQEEEVHKLQKLENIGLLAGGIAHDFNNMLTAILGNISLAQLKLEHNHPSAQYLQRSEESIEKATELATQLLTFAKGGEPVKEVVEIFPLIKETIKFDLAGSNVTANFNSECKSTLTEFDKGQFQQIISNITINAVQSMPKGGQLHIHLTDADDAEINKYELVSGKYFKLEIKDQGEGMDENTLRNIFAPYYTTKSNGHGLGMTIVHSIIKKHQAAIDIVSNPGTGTTVSILLPLVEDKIPTLNQETDTACDEVDDLSILILDDDETILGLVTAMFEEKGAIVTTAKDGLELISIYQESLVSSQHYDVIIFDLTIPGGMGGKEAITEIKKLNEHARCIVSSGYADDPVMANFQEYGFQAAVPKPYNLHKLYEAVTELAAKKSGV